MTQVIPLPAFSDNYIWLIRDREHAVVVDPGDANPVLDYLQSEKLDLCGLLITHHHRDHTGGIQPLLAKFPQAQVWGPAQENIAGVMHKVVDGQIVPLEAVGLSLQVIEVPGHTLGHIAYYGQGHLFCGDTLFSGGCGRLFEGTAAQMLTSLERLAALPPQTQVYCAHEYTLNNLAFAQTLEPESAELQAYLQRCKQMRAKGLPTLPSSIKQEKAINPFLRCHLPTLQDLAPNAANTLETFTWVRAQKDTF